MPRHNDSIKTSGPPLPPAVTGHPGNLTPTQRDRIRALFGPAPLAFLMQMARAWMAIALAIALAEWIQTWWSTVLAILYIPTRMNILGLLMHEQAHHLGSRARLGDWICDWFGAYPLFCTVSHYRDLHLKHHKYFFTKKDHDYLRKQGPEWTFPQLTGTLIRTLLSDVLAINVFKMPKGKRSTEARSVSAIPRILYYGSVLILMTATGTFSLLLCYWILPLFTVFQLIVRLGAICEHKYDLINPTLYDSTPLIEPRWWEKILLPNLNFTLHIYHHYFPNVPFLHLPKVHAIFKEAGWVEQGNIFRGYWPYLSRLMSGPDLAWEPDSPTDPLKIHSAQNKEPQVLRSKAQSIPSPIS